MLCVSVSLLMGWNRSVQLPSDNIGRRKKAKGCFKNIRDQGVHRRTGSLKSLNAGSVFESPTLKDDRGESLESRLDQISALDCRHELLDTFINLREE